MATVKVKFVRASHDNSVYGVFIDEKFSYKEGLTTCYIHCGERGQFSQEWFLNQQKAAEAEYQELLHDLKGLGYNVEAA